MIERMMQWLTGSAAEPPWDAIGLFMEGHSIPALSAPAGQQMIARQREIEAEIRAYIEQLERENTELRSALHYG